MSALNSLNSAPDIQDEEDYVGGSGALDSGIYPSKVTMAFLQKSDSGATALNLHLMTDTNREIRQSLWIASGNAKGNKTYYETKQGEKKYLPGFALADNLCLLTVGKSITDMSPEEKMVNVYSSVAGKEVPTKVEVLT